MGKTYIKINSQIDDKVKGIISKIETFEGVISAKLNLETQILDYEISEWASDYDIMVEILNYLEELSISAEPIFDGEEEISVEKHQEIEDEHCEFHHHHEHCECDHHHECEDEHEHGVSCSCGNDHNSTKKERKIKFFELLASTIILILGIILKNIETTKAFANYVLIVAYAVAGYEIMFEGLISIFKGKPFRENTLMTIASLAAILFGEVVEAVGIMLLFSIGELFEQTAISSADKIIDKLKEYKDEKVKVLNDGIIKIVSPEKVKIGDIIVISQGEKNALDGEIIEGSCSFDTKVITGESAYKDLSVGDAILGGYVCISGTIKVKVTKTYEDSAVSKICETVKDSAKKKTKTETFLEKFAKWYTPLVVVLALLVAFIPPIFSSEYLSGLRVWGVRAIMLLCVSCPCSLVISVPLAYYTAVGSAAKHGLIIKNSAIFDKISNLKTIVYDKTGTLTDGTLKVTKIISVKKYQGKVLNLIALCEKYSNHPIALAIRKKAGDISQDVTDYKEIAGKGVTCKFNDQNLVCGNEKFLLENGIKVLNNDNLGVKLYLAVDGEYAGVIVLEDTIRSTARGSILELKDCGIENTVMLTGDNEDYAEFVKESLQITDFKANLLPENKVTELENVMKVSQGSTMFIGDGVNDAPSLMRSDVGVAMGNGTDVAIDSADIVLTNGDLSKIPYLYNLAKKTAKKAKQNVILSLAVKFIVMILSITGLSSSLWLAIGADVGLLIITILNSIFKF